MLVWNQFNYGISNNFSMGIGFELVSLLDQDNSENNGTSSKLPGFTLTPKYSIPIEENKVNIGVGAVVLHYPGSENLFDAGGVYGLATFGSRDRNFTFGLGLGADREASSLGDDENDKLIDAPVLLFSGVYRLNKRIALTTENWFLKDDNVTVGFNTFGIRFLGNRASFDLGIIGSSGFGDGYHFSPVPVGGVVIPFGKGWKR